MIGSKGQLDERKSVILKTVVMDYIRTAQPVGSQYLAERYTLGVKPATIRNELAEMSDMGYLRQPHTSAGRVPSDLGYRFFVDRLMEPTSVSQIQRNRALSELECASEVENIVYHTCRILARLTNYTSLATRPSTEKTTISLVTLSCLSKNRLLFVMVLSDGIVEHRILDIKHQMTDAQVIKLGNILTSQMAGKTLGQIPVEKYVPADNVPNAEVYRAAISCVKEIAKSAKNDEVFVEGTSNILKQPEFQNVEKLERLLQILEERRMLVQLLSIALTGHESTVVIGSENPYPEMHDASFVAARYFVSDSVCGTIGVIGPTRMDYGKASAAVTLMAKSLSDLLTSMILS